MARSSMEGSNIASLPGDILHQILLEVGMCYVDRDDWTHGIRMDGDLRALKNVRLTCRILYNIATPLLFPVLHASINYRSVDRFEKLCRNPLIADYVRGVFVNLAMYSRELAENPSKFREQKLRELDWVHENLHRDVDFRSDPDTYVEEYYRLSHELDCLADAWMDTKHHDSEARASYRHVMYNDSDGKRKREYQDVLCNGYKEYVQGRLFNCAYQRDIAVLRDNVPQALCRAMSQPHIWEDLDQHDTQNTLELVSVLSMLPIAISEAGGPMKEVHVQCFPHYGSFSLLFRGAEQKSAEVKQKLQRAYQNLETFRFGWMSCKAFRRHPLPDEDQSYRDDYIQAALSSCRLQDLELDLGTYGIKRRGTVTDKKCDIRPLLHLCTSSQLRKVWVSNFRCTYQEIEPFLAGLGDCLQDFCIESIELLDGDWSSLLDTVCQKVARRCQEGRCMATLSGLLGGEEKLQVHFAAGMSDDEVSALHKTPKIIEESGKYIRGARSTNPLRGQN